MSRTFRGEEVVRAAAKALDRKLAPADPPSEPASIAFIDFVNETPPGSSSSAVSRRALPDVLNTSSSSKNLFREKGASFDQSLNVSPGIS